MLIVHANRLPVALYQCIKFRSIYIYDLTDVCKSLSVFVLFIVVLSSISLFLPRISICCLPYFSLYVVSLIYLSMLSLFFLSLVYYFIPPISSVVSV
jgi:hypothetical protein